MADYDKGELTDREKLAGKRQKEIAQYNDATLTGSNKYSNKTANTLANWNSGMQNKLAKQNVAQTTQIAKYNAKATGDQFNRQTQNYDFANRQNASLRDTQFKQAARKSEAERFEAQRNLRNAALGLLGTMGNQAMNSSTLGNTMFMFRDRNDADNSTYWQGLQDNRNAIQNAYDESYNQNQVAKRDAAINAIKALQDIDSGLASDLGNIQGDLFANLTNIRGDLLSSLSNNDSDLYVNQRNLRGDLAANLNNINPNLYAAPGSGFVENETSKDDKNKTLKIRTLPNVKIPSSGYKIPKNLSTIKGMQNANGKLTNPIYRRPGSNSAINSRISKAESALNNTKQHNATLLDYLMPANAEQNVVGRRNKLGGNDYFSQLVNGFNY